MNVKFTTNLDYYYSENTPTPSPFITLIIDLYNHFYKPSLGMEGTLNAVEENLLGQRRNVLSSFILFNSLSPEINVEKLTITMNESGTMSTSMHRRFEFFCYIESEEYEIIKNENSASDQQRTFTLAGLNPGSKIFVIQYPNEKAEGILMVRS